MSSLDEIRNERIKKLKLLKERDMEPYPIASHRDLTIGEAVLNFSELVKRKKHISLVGRVLTLRRQGGLIFFHFYDGTGKMQGLLKRGEIKEDLFSLFLEAVDSGDFLELKGSSFITKQGERTLLVSNWKMLAKSLRPLPEKWHGLKDVEERFRRRYLDVLVSSEVRDRFVVRSKLISEIRAFLDGRGFLEVETPALQPLYGGGSAEPFTTHHNVLNVDLYLRISNELYLKRLLIGGFPKVYEIYKGFRNEGIDAVHYPEFTMLEWYESYSDAVGQRLFVEEMLRALVQKLLGKKIIPHNGEKINFSKKFEVLSYHDVHPSSALRPPPLEIERDELVSRTQPFIFKV